MGAQEIAGDQLRMRPLTLKTGRVCLLIGTLGFATARLLHGDTPAADADAALTFVAGRPTYAAVHVVAVLAATTIAIGIMALASSLIRPSACLLGRAGTTTAVIGVAIFGVESTSEGLALPELASAAQADPGQRADVVTVARAIAAATHGPSLVAIALFIGATLLLIGLSIRLEGYPGWLGILGAIIGAVALTAAVGLYLRPSLFPGALLYGVLASVVAQLWLAAVGVAMLRRAISGSGSLAGQTFNRH
ncbi:MAG TPA: DUF4386 family protein [Propionibacteriaceae bacterium]|nr:DUF4386 family protein [Propionibacteriaceae bacterium]